MHEAWNFISNLKTLNESILSVHSTLDAREAGSEFQHGMHIGQMDAARMTLEHIKRFYEAVNQSP